MLSTPTRPGDNLEPAVAGASTVSITTRMSHQNASASATAVDNPPRSGVRMTTSPAARSRWRRTR
jgi:hypothetical protein